ncbi:GNAT family N-acetyltransferase [Slackia heliotrinireducens]|uniref:GNAT family N-acetyltransferase n=1 Tax=Slackia heliotrinireducens TaxID=84110 RepID=UPI003314E736
MVSFIPVVSEEQLGQLADVADEIWHEYWPAIIGIGQTDYMVERFQSLPAIKRDIADHGYRYWFIHDSEQKARGGIVGYTGGRTETETNRFFISKIYLFSDARGHGYCSRTIEFYDQLCKNESLRAMYLTVNKHNDLGIRAYLAKGFETIDSVETDIGSGYVMDDYIMERQA